MKLPALSLALPLLAFGCGPKVPAQAPATLEPQVDQTAAQSAPDSKRVGDFYRGVAHSTDDRTDWRVTLDPTQCYTFVGGGDSLVQKLYLYLWDPKDSRVADMKEDTTQPVMTYCPEKPGQYRLQAKVTEGKGHYRVGIYAKAAPPKAAPPPPPSPENLDEMLDKEAASSAAGAELIGNHYTGSGDKTDWYAQLDNTSCYWLIGIGAKSVNELYVYLWDSNNKRINETKSDNRKAIVGYCPVTSGMYHVQAKVNSGSGAFKLGVYGKKK